MPREIMGKEREKIERQKKNTRKSINVDKIRTGR